MRTCKQSIATGLLSLRSSKFALRNVLLLHLVLLLLLMMIKI
jgi:hypothetical protein